MPKRRRSSTNPAALAGSHKIGGTIPREALSIVDYHPVSGKQKQSLQRQENWQYCSTMP
jgi:hypothetical protein